MSIQRIPGQMLESNLTRSTDLAFQTDLLYLDVVNGRVGVKTAAPGNFALDVNGTARFQNSVEISGDLTVTGTTTTVDTQNLTIEDNIIVLNSSGSIGNDAGIMINRGSAGNNAAFYWDETTTKFKTVTTTSDGSTVTNIDDTAYARLSAADAVDNYDLVNLQSMTSYVSAAMGATLGSDIALGDVSDSSFSDGALVTLGSAPSVTDALDDLNETMENIRAGTYVKSVDFTSNYVVGGAGLTVTLTITTVGGGANRYDIDWGTGETATVGTASTSPTHTYSSNTNSPFTLTVTAYNNTATVGSAGSSASKTRTNYIIIYTANPVVSYDFYRASTGGSALSGNDLYVVEGDSLYVQNNTTNTASATVTYTMAWADGTSNDSIANNSAAGGVLGSRLQHTYANGTQTSTSTITTQLTLATHNTANPAAIPTNTTKALKVYDDAIAAPNALSSKTITFSGSVGTSPKLAVGFTDNTGGAVYVAGNSVNRTVATSGTIDSVAMTSFAYNANSGTLSAKVNGSTNGSRVLTSGDDSGTYTSLIIDSESDYQLLNAAGATVTFANSIYYPTLYKGFKAHIAKAASAVSAGVNSFKLSHSDNGDTNLVEFVKDSVTATPTTTIGTVTQKTAGTFQYVSGIPYYNTGSPALYVTGTTVSNLTGQCYSDVSNPHEIDPGTTSEGSGSIIANLDYTYSNIDGSTTMLTGGIPNVNTGVSSAYTLGQLTANLTSSSMFSVSTIKARSSNCNGTGSYSESATKIQVYTASASAGYLNKDQSGIAVSDSLGNGTTYTDDAVRISGFGTAADNPSFVSGTNYYTGSAWSGAVTVAGTKEATMRPTGTTSGVIRYDVTNYSSGYLPAGPDRSGDTGSQYFTFVFRRTPVSQFSITMTGRVSGMWIAAPGSGIDSAASAQNGWLNCSTQYGGAGVPSVGCAKTGSDVVSSGTTYSAKVFTFTLGTESLANSTGNTCLVRIKLASGDSVTALSVGVAA